MATTIKLKNSVTTTAVPSSLAQGEVATNVTDKKLWVGNAASSPVQFLGAGATVSGTNVDYTGTLTGGTGVVNLGSGQFYKDASGNVGIGITNPSANGQLAVLSPSGGITYGLVGRSADGYGRFQAWDRSGTVGTGSVAFFEDGTISLNRSNTGSLVENMRIDSSGNVGIGTSSPSSPLDVVSDSSTNALRIRGRSSDNAGSVRLYSNDNATQYSYLRADASDVRLSAVQSVPMLFLTANTERMRIDSSGNVGIGTSSVGAKLDVSSGALAGAFIIGGDVNTSSGARTDATRKYAVVGSYPYTNANRSSAVLVADNDGTDNVLYIGGGQAQLNAITSMRFYTGATNNTATGTERMRIDSSGNVGIGTSSPGRPLSVSGTATNLVNFASSGAETNFQISNSSTNGRSYEIISGGSGGAFAGGLFGIYDRTAGAARLAIDSSGNLLVGTTTTPTAGHGTIGVKGAGTYYSFGSQTNGSTSFVVFNGSGTGVYLANGGTSWTANSDERLKTEITPFENAVEKISSLRSGTGRYLTDDESVSRSFLIAQDVQKVLPEAVNIPDTKTGYLGLQYQDIIPLLVAAIKEQQVVINELKAKVAALEAA